MAKTNATFTKHARDAQKHGETLRVYLEKLAAQREKFKNDISKAVHQADIAVATFKAHGADKHHGLKLKQDMEAKLKALEDVKSEYQDWAKDAAQGLTSIPAHHAKLVEEIEALSTEASAPRWKQAVAKAAGKPQAQPTEPLHIAPREDAVPLHTKLVKETRNAPTVRQPAAVKTEGVKASLKHALEIMRAPSVAKANQLAAEAETAIAEAVQAINASYKQVASPLDDALAEQKHLSAAFKAMDDAKQAEASTKAPLGEAVVAVAAKARKAYDDFITTYRASKAQSQAAPVAQGPVPTTAERLHADKENVAAFYAATQKRIIETAEKMKQKREERAAAREAPQPHERPEPSFTAAFPKAPEATPSPLPGTNIQVVAFINSQREGILATLADVLNTECPDIVAHDRNVTNLARHILNKAVTQLKASDIATGDIEQLAEQAIVEAHKSTLAELRADMAQEAAKAQTSKAGEDAFELLQRADIRGQFKLELATEFQKELGTAFTAKVTHEELKRMVEYVLSKAENALDERDFGTIEAAQLATFAVDSAFKTVIAEIRNPKQNLENADFKPNAGAVLHNPNVKREPRPDSLASRLDNLIDADADLNDDIHFDNARAIAARFAPHGAQRAVREADKQKPVDSSLSINADDYQEASAKEPKPAIAGKRGLISRLAPQTRGEKFAFRASVLTTLTGLGALGTVLIKDTLNGNYPSYAELSHPVIGTKSFASAASTTSNYIKNENAALHAEAEARKLAARFDEPDMSRYKNISAADYEKLSDREKAMLGEGDLALQQAREGTESQQATAQPEEKSVSSRIKFEDEKNAGSHQKAKPFYSETYTKTVPMEGYKGPVGGSFDSGFSSSFNWNADKDDKGPGKG